MIKVLGMIITVVSIAGIALLLELTTGIGKYTVAWVRTRLSPSSPLTGGERGEGGEDPDTDTEEEDI